MGFRRHAAAKPNYTHQDDSEEDEQEISKTRRRSMESTHSLSLTSLHQLAPHGQRYVKVKSKAKSSSKYLSKMILAQVLATDAQTSPHDHPDPDPHPSRPHQAVWALKFSKDGKYVAAAGQDCTIRVWQVINDTSHPETIKVFDDKPIQEYKGHTADILDISWSKNNFLLSSSMDKTVRLWHVSKSECLCVFMHLDFVTSVKFHPKDDRFFLSGSLDGKVRLWSIMDKKVAYWNEVPDESMITAVGFTLDGRTACVGSYTGLVFFYETQGLKYNTQIVVKKKGAKKGKKITGIEPMPNMPPGEEKLLITSNDSRIRMINMKDKSLIYKYKGLVNNTMQIKATFSDDGKFIICGSEDGGAYVWPTGQTSFSPYRYSRDTYDHGFSDDNSLHPSNTATFSVPNSTGPTPRIFTGAPASDERAGLAGWLKRSEQRVKEKLLHPHEHFDAHKSIVTSAIFAPLRTRQQLASTGCDLIYNHTSLPLTKSASNDTSTIATLSLTSLAPSDLSDAPSKELLERSKYDYAQGQIIVTADGHGAIHVWRLDSGQYANRSPLSHRASNLTIASLSPPLKRHSMDGSAAAFDHLTPSLPPSHDSLTTASTSSQLPVAPTAKPSSQKRSFHLFSSLPR
ncbi:WD40 repeat-like protein [Hesseltinella vesiculosa]|uniref:WD40 repeat-like protein n=1 Tax=Hesseltinella vesiculosa TaxID=101127 RepID=A0A1X2GM43_9FUNG|nr:WD40 repeat-like protein [Hesseltinella vesiculosa]